MSEVQTGLEGVLKFRNIAGTASVDTGSTLSYVTGFDYSWEENKKDIWNRATFAHYKKGRPAGKLTVKELYVNQGSADVWPTSSTYWTVPTVAFTLEVDDIAGTVGETLMFQRCAKDSTALSQPEEDTDTFDISATFGSKVTF